MRRYRKGIKKVIRSGIFFISKISTIFASVIYQNIYARNNKKTKFVWYKALKPRF